MKKSTLLGGLSPDEFLRDYWQKKPLLIRQAIAGFSSPVERDKLLAMGSDEEVESRLISSFNGKWKMASGPHVSLPNLRKKNWSLLVQGVNLHDAAGDALLRQFRFLPDARLDDLMISFATDGGGVGPHFDSYDVFLLQAQGQRRWRISQQKDLSLQEGLPLKILSNFVADEEYVLEPGDMLYLPPQYAHEGVAIGECITCSIGLRAPSFQELAEGFLQFMSDTIELDGRYADSNLKPTSRPAEISSEMLSTIADHLQQIKFEQADITVFLGEYLSAPKNQVVFQSPARPLNPQRFAEAVAKRGLRLSLRTLMLYTGKHVFINGDSFVAGPKDRKTLHLLADKRCLSSEEFADASTDVKEALCSWYEDGFLAPC